MYESYSQSGALYKVNTKSNVCGCSAGLSLKTKVIQSTQKAHMMLALT